MPTPAESDRVELEAKIMFLERTVEVLQGVVQEQARSIATMEERFERLEEQLRNGGEDQVSPHHDPPPHY